MTIARWRLGSPRCQEIYPVIPERRDELLYGGQMSRESIATEQVRLNQEQIEEFYTDIFAFDQIVHFKRLTESVPAADFRTVVDIGGGCGYFARELNRKTGLHVRVVDTDRQSIENCRKFNAQGVEAHLDDALNPTIRGDEDVICFNLILHHLIGSDEQDTREMQKRALRTWLSKTKFVFVNEYVYDSMIGYASGRLIYEITRSKLLSAIGMLVSKLVPSLRANTFGVGVRFRAHSEWITLFGECGYEVVSKTFGEIEPVSLARRILLINKVRRDSFLLQAKTR